MSGGNIAPAAISVRGEPTGYIAEQGCWPAAAMITSRCVTLKLSGMMYHYRLSQIEYRLFSFLTQNGPHRDQSQNPLGACMLSRTGGLAKGAGWLPTPTERCKL